MNLYPFQQYVLYPNLSASKPPIMVRPCCAVIRIARIKPIKLTENPLDSLKYVDIKGINIKKENEAIKSINCTPFRNFKTSRYFCISIPPSLC